MTRTPEISRIWLQFGVRRLGACLALLSGFVTAVATDGSGPQAQVLAISDPPPPVLPSDPPLGLVYGLPADLSAATAVFDTATSPSGPVTLEYLRFDPRGDAYLTFDAERDEDVAGGLFVIDDLANRDGGSFDVGRDRRITGAATGLVQPKSLAVADRLGFVIVADFGDSSLKVFDARADGDAAPLFVTDTLGDTAAGEPRAPWGVAFDAAADRLFVAATDGTILVFDDYLIDRGRDGPDRSIVPTRQGEKASANLHDLIYLDASDVLIVSDVGAATTSDEPGFDTDGKLFVMEGASTADGNLEAAVQVSGAASFLGNPVGLAYDGANLYVAEKSRDVVLRFDGVLSHSGTIELAPSGAVTVLQPESVVLR